MCLVWESECPACSSNPKRRGRGRSNDWSCTSYGHNNASSVGRFQGAPSAQCPVWRTCQHHPKSITALLKSRAVYRKQWRNMGLQHSCALSQTNDSREARCLPLEFNGKLGIQSPDTKLILILLSHANTQFPCSDLDLYSTHLNIGCCRTA